MAREKMTPEQAATKEYRQTRRYYDTITEREIIHGLTSWSKRIDALTERRKTKPAPFAAAVDAAKLQAIRDALAAKRATTTTTINDYAGADTAAEAVYPTAPDWLSTYTAQLADQPRDVTVEVEPNGCVIFRGPLGSCTVTTGPDTESFSITGPASELRAFLIHGALGIISPIETRQTKPNA